MAQENLGTPMSPRYSAQSDLLRMGSETGAMAVSGLRICLVDPDPLTRAQLGEYLRGKGFDIFVVTDMETSPPSADLLIVALDSMEQRANRPRWLSEKPKIPTIVLDRSHVFPGRAASIGFAPDARLPLPVHPRKLVATIKRALSLVRIESIDLSEDSVPVYHFSGWKLHCHERQLESRDGESTPLGKQEFEVLRALLACPRQLLTRQQLIAIAWGSGKQVENRRLDRPITLLRHHLGDDSKFPALLKTVVGVGYRLDVEVEKSV
ncbi:MAG: hypothetical protein B7X93_08005 [Hydrogenophilales bacterium 17-61-9]|nr:MAG: hypothetical protein B7X93_08005 [Hydrogenophilales bacterium 17-61-9]